MRAKLFSFLIVAGLAFANSAFATVKVVTSLTDLAWMVKEIGREHVSVKPLLRGTENPHYVDTVPDYIAEVADAQIVCIVGLELEVGWMPKVLAKSGNAQVQPGGKGYCETGKTVNVIQKPAGGVDRSMGDVHPTGNPHFWLSPEALAQSSAVVVDTLSRVDPPNAAAYQKNGDAFKAAMKTLLEKNRAKLKPELAKIPGAVLVEYHQEFSYFLDAYGLKTFGAVEEKPGVPPSAGRIAEIAIAAKQAGIKFFLAAETSPKKTVAKFVELSGIPLMQVSPSVQAKNGSFDYVGYQNQLVDQVVKYLAGQKAR